MWKQVFDFKDETVDHVFLNSAFIEEMMIDTRQLAISPQAIEQVKIYLLNDRKSWDNWKDKAEVVTDYALRALVCGVVVDVAYLGVPLIPFGVAITADFILQATLGLRIVRENLSYLGAAKLSSYTYSAYSLATLGKVNIVFLSITLPTAGARVFRGVLF
jgi:hypothetical protein